VTTWNVSFVVASDEQWSPNSSGLTTLGSSGVSVPATASITQAFVPGYFYQPPVNLGDPVTATWETTDPGPGWLRVTDPQTTRQ
jgi:hypothetical protein